ncbi:uncharacterized protein LOC142563662 isoform X2 [Dermacentor variabilis]|uniref:uncharacterized protein LOC142563662 isoform X2 n=1 Tax=Dermacentor variabilis TaxID=34621 RepID=UPI003F5B7769
MMHRLTVMFLWFITHGCTEGAKVPASSQNHPPLKWYDGKETIGEGVTLKAHIFYDSEIYTRQAPEGNVTKYFTDLFSQAEKHFHNNSVMITMEIQNISMNKDQEVKIPGKPKVLDGNATLKRLQNYSESHTLTNDSIIYQFTNKTPVDNGYFGAAFPDVFSTFSTLGTFCSDARSAAIISQPPTSRTYWMTVKATAATFGTKNFIQFRMEDIKKMNETFLRCHAKEISQNSEED